MSNEINVQITFRARLNNLKYQPPAKSFSSDLVYPIGPTPAAVLVTEFGTEITFAQLTRPGWCVFTNIDDTDNGNIIHLGPYDPETDRWYPYHQIRPGHSAVIEFSSLFGWEVYPFEPAGLTGTGTGGKTNKLLARASTGDCYIQIEAFEGDGT